MAPTVGGRLGTSDILGELGLGVRGVNYSCRRQIQSSPRTGGMDQVFRARDTGLALDVASQVLPHDLAGHVTDVLPARDLPRPPAAAATGTVPGT